MEKSYHSWTGGTLLCISVAAALKLISSEPLSAITYCGIACVIMAHAATGYVVVERRVGRAQPLISVGLAMFWTAAQVSLAWLLYRTLEIELSVSTAQWLMAVGFVGQCMLLTAALKFASSTAVDASTTSASARG